MTEGIRYKKNYLTGVIFRINFSNILQLSGRNKEAAEKFKETGDGRIPLVGVSAIAKEATRSSQRRTGAKHNHATHVLLPGD